MADDLISTDHGSNNIPHCKQAICCNISLRTWGIAWFEYAHIPASQLSPLGNTHLPPSCKLNVAERHLQLPAFQLGAPARREQQSHAQALASDRGGKKKSRVRGYKSITPASQPPTPLTVGTPSNHVTETQNQGQTLTRCSESEAKRQGSREQRPAPLLCHGLSTAWTAERFYYALAMVKLNVFTAITGEGAFITDKQACRRTNRA